MGQLALLQYIETCKTKKFKYGEFDCALFTVECIDKFYSLDIAKNFYGLWNNKIDAIKYNLSKNGTSSMLKDHGFKEFAFNYMRMGDIISQEQAFQGKKRWYATSVCLGEHTAVVTETDGLVLIPNDEILGAVGVYRWPLK